MLGLGDAHQGKAKDTISILGLNNYDLVQGRINALQALEGLTDAEATALAQLARQGNKGQHLPFCNAVAGFLQDYYGV